jgi:hypothetical protein
MSPSIDPPGTRSHDHGHGRLSARSVRLLLAFKGRCRFALAICLGSVAASRAAAVCLKGQPRGRELTIELVGGLVKDGAQG